MTGHHPTGISRVQVVIPARDEEARLGACLRSVERAVRHLRDARPEIRVGVTVVLDRCTDASAAVASRFAVDVVSSHWGNVGAARRAGIEHAVLSSPDRPGSTWVACTDADTVVPATWLLDQVLQAGAGVQLVVGPVVPDPVDGDEAVARLWRERHRGALAGDHVHGANLGFRLDAYRAVGGFPALAEHEDVALVRALRAHGVRQGVAPTVVTSARLVGRTPGGFAGYLRDLDEGRRVEA
ncbi:glycosyltransferase family A protein [Nocardioides sp.]|uniref:glycosyltransferase n=1 Tax=Nocardioides sp. TaxID=35761 RepID=UPI00286ADA09|nr:glycosyltransferase family A protein [Nocardioides sp.]